MQRCTAKGGDALELKWVEDFLSLARHRSFSRAAIERHVTQPALSRRIRALEHWVGAPLFDRSSFPITLTEFGVQFQPHAEEIVRTAHGVRDDFLLLRRPKGPAIRIVTLYTLASTLVADWVAALMRDQPRARVVVIPSLQGVGDHFDALANGLADLLITYAHAGITDKAIRDNALEFLTLRHDAFVPVVAPEVFRHFGPTPISEGRGPVPYLSYASYSFSDKLVAPAVRPVVRRLRTVYENGLSECLRAQVLRGAGLAWLPLHLIEEDLQEGRLCEVEHGERRIPYEIRACRTLGTDAPLRDLFWDMLVSASGPSEPGDTIDTDRPRAMDTVDPG